MNFKTFQQAVESKVNELSGGVWLETNIDKDELFAKYLESFPTGSNPKFRERTEHDCNCCKNFIRDVGNIIVITEDNRIETIWNVTIPTEKEYQTVTNRLHAYVLDQFRKLGIKDIYLHYKENIGAKLTIQETDQGNINWDHFYCRLPLNLVKLEDDIKTELARVRDAKQVFARTMKEIPQSAYEICIDLIEQGSVYRGEEFLALVKLMSEFKGLYDVTDKAYLKEILCWLKAINVSSAVTKMRNKAIGTFLVDIAEGLDLTEAVDKFGKKMDPANYQRPKTIATKRMIEAAEKDAVDNGLINSLGRRFAKIDDITVNNVIWANRDAAKAMGGNAFQQLAAEQKADIRSLKNVESISISDFIEKVLPKAKSIKALFESRHQNNLVSLIAPLDMNAKKLFKWNNNFAWSYNNNVADSMREAVKAAGGCIDADFRISLRWFNYDDLDLHVVEPNGNRIGFDTYRAPAITKTKGQLDVDENAGSGKTRKPVENIVFLDKTKMLEGLYQVKVNNYSLREQKDVGFDLEIEYNGSIYQFSYKQKVLCKQTIDAITFNFTNLELDIVQSIDSQAKQINVWNMNSGTWQPVNIVTFSPNHWDEQGIGNKHYMFMLEGCKNPNQPRGFFNEFLRSDMTKHRKTFEMLGQKMKVAKSNEQLSGLGFSSTQRNNLIVQVEGSFNRVLKVQF